MRTPLVIVTSVATLLVVAGCAVLPESQPTAEPTASASARPSASPSSSPSAEPDGGSTKPVPACSALVSLDTMYEYNSNVALTPDYRPSGGSLVARVASTGVACGWTNLSSGEVIAIAVGAPQESGLDAFDEEFAGWSAADWSGVDGYFTVIGGEGHAAAIVDGFVVVGVSSAFYEAADAQPLVVSALDAL